MSGSNGKLVSLTIALTLSAAACGESDAESKGSGGAGNASSTYSVSVKVDPPEATIELDGRRIGSGAYSATFQADSRKHTLRMSAPGRQTQSLDFDAMSPPPKEVVLAPLAGAPEPPKPDKKLGPKTAPGAKRRSKRNAR